MLTKFRIVFLLCSTLALLISCGGIKTQKNKSSFKLYETFFVGDDGTQYFIKPLIFKGLDNSEFHIDFTFRHKKEVKGAANIHISIISDKQIKDLKQVNIENANSKLVLEQFDFLFLERDKEMFHSRFSTSTELVNLLPLFEKSDWKITTMSNREAAYNKSSATEKAIEKLQYEVFSIL